MHTEETGPCPPLRFTNCSRSFSYLYCNSFYRCESARYHEMSFNSRHKKLSMNYVLELKTCPNNLAYWCVFEPPNSTFFKTPVWLLLLPSNSTTVWGFEDRLEFGWSHCSVRANLTFKSVFDKLLKRLQKPWNLYTNFCCCCYWNNTETRKLCLDFYQRLQSR